MAERTLFGRERPLSILHAALTRTIAGHGGLVLVTGEPGIGKTALVAEVATEAKRRGCLVLSGACWDGDSPPGYWPWVQILRALQRSAPDIWLRFQEVGGEIVARLLGESSDTGPGDDPTFQLCDSISRAFLEAAQFRPVVVVLDDLHWADDPSIRVLDFLVRHLALERLLIIATYRDAELQVANHPLRAALLGLVPKATPISLGGLDLESTALLIGQAADRQPNPSLVADLQRTTGGNPFFIQQAALLWAANGSIMAMAPAVHDAIERRLARLQSATVAVLTWAAVLGYDFDAQLLAAATDQSNAEVERHLYAAASAHLLAPAGAGRFRFSHDLVRQTLNDMLDEDSRRLRHAAIVRAVTNSAQLQQSALPAQIADHAYLGGPSVGMETAVRLLSFAGRHASGRLAVEEACVHFERALQLVPATAATTAQRMRLLLALGPDQRRAGRLDAARTTFELALELARDARDPEAFAHAALGLHALGEPLDAGREPIELMDEAYAWLSTTRPADTALRARLAAAASQVRTHHLGEDRVYAEQLSAQSVHLARESGDDDALGFCLLAHHDAIWRPGTAAARVGIAQEMAVVGRRSSNREMELQAALLRTIALLEQGDARGFDQYVDFVDAAERSGLLRFRYLALSRRATINTLQGNFDQARQSMDEALSLGEQIGEVDAYSVWGDQRWELERLRGDMTESTRLVTRFVAQGVPHAPILQSMLALDRGDPTLARASLAEIEAIGERWPRWAQTMWLSFRCELAAATRQADLLAEARLAVTPVLDNWVVLGGAVVVHGPMAYWAGLLDQAEHRWDDAIRKFEQAHESAERLRAHPWSIVARLRLTECLLQRKRSGDTDRAVSLLGEIERGASDLEMHGVLRRLRVISAPSVPPLVCAHNVWRFDGQVWTLGFAGRTINMPDAKGFQDLRKLLGKPGYAIPVTHLINGVAPHETGADPMLDEQARTAYARRLEELQQAIDAALDQHHDNLASRLDREREALVRELRASTGLGGRKRRLGDATERARKTVTARIRDALRHLETRHPELAEHLRSSVSMGSTCCYQPAEPITWHF